MRAVLTQPDQPVRFKVAEVPDPSPALDQALVLVDAFSMNQGETRTALDATEIYVPGWDFAGVVEQAAANGSSPPVGTRVFGFVHQGAWAQRVAVRSAQLAPVPDAVTTTVAAALPVAGTTAMLCLEKAGSLLGRKLLITGAAGGVGRFACRLAAMAGADVYAVSRRAGLEDDLRLDGVTPVAVFRDAAQARAAGRYDVIFDSVGGRTLSELLMALAKGGTCINCGNSERQATSFDAIALYRSGGARLLSVWLGTEAPGEVQAALHRLMTFVARGDLTVPVDSVWPWERVAEGAERLLEGKVAGKLVFSVSGNVNSRTT